MRKLISVCLLGVFTFALLVPPSAQAHIKVACKPETGRRFADPIVFNKVLGETGHLHTFLANRTLPTLAEPNTATYSQMVGQPTTCLNPSDSAGYWFPTVLRNGVNLPVFRFTAYYRDWDYVEKQAGNEQGLGNTAYPPDTRMVAGLLASGEAHVTWNCNQASTRPGPYADPVAAACHTAQLKQPGQGQVLLGVHIDFPTCFTGNLNDHTVTGQTADFHYEDPNVNNQFAYPFTNANNQVVCPAGFPVKVPSLRMAISWDYQGNGLDLTNSAGPWDHFHADFWNTWVQSGPTNSLTAAITRCINTTTNHAHGNANICG